MATAMRTSLNPSAMARPKDVDPELRQLGQHRPLCVRLRDEETEWELGLVRKQRKVGVVPQAAE
ncbi:unnamed protein product [Mycena citricolor]|uniref:Uncharacterized protein n=1 Tax=Mycena citricolor TaxID=2018698 RepID=A0AAD2GYX9_9AGAR|nr:unnamed protein product [Mycena citricolor]